MSKGFGHTVSGRNLGARELLCYYPRHIGGALLVRWDPGWCGVRPPLSDIRKTPSEVAQRPTPGIFARKLREKVPKLRLSSTYNRVRLMFLRPLALQRVMGRPGL